MGPNIISDCRIAVIGCGLIGGSFALAARRAGFKVVAFDPDPGTQEAARRLGLDVAASACDAAASARLVLLAGPADTVVDCFLEIEPSLQPDTIVTDAASTKSRIAHQLRGKQTVIPGHPMAGRATSGIFSASEGLFDGCTWVLCPPSDVNQVKAELLVEVLSAMGVARVLLLSPDEHDRAAAAISHLPQIVATLAAGNALREDDLGDVLRLAAGGFKDTTRIAASPGRLWAPILVANRSNITAQLERLIVDAETLRDAVESGDEETIVRLFEAGNLARRRLENLTAERGV